MCVRACACVRPAGPRCPLIRCSGGQRSAATDDSAVVSGRLALISLRLHMLPIKIRHLAAHLAESTHLLTRDTSVDKTLNTHGRGRATERRDVGIGRLAPGVCYLGPGRREEELGALQCCCWPLGCFIKTGYRSDFSQWRLEVLQKKMPWAQN